MRYPPRMETGKIIVEIDAEIDRLKQAKAILTGSVARSPRSGTVAPKRQLSPEARAKIAAAQKARWAKAKKGAK